MFFDYFEEAIVAEEIRPNQCGRVRFQCSWWAAKCDKGITLKPGDLVYVVGIDKMMLLVESMA